MEKTKKVKHLFQDLSIEDNVRLPQNVSALSADIEENGLQTYPLVWDRGDKMVILRGHRRHAALLLLKERNSVRFDELFGKGIECDTVSGITKEMAADLKGDHGNEEPLSHPHELQMSASLHFDAGRTEKEVVVKLAGLMDRVCPMTNKARKDYKILTDAISAASDVKVKWLAEQAAEKFLGDYRRGLVQGLHNAHRCPELVMSCLWSQAVGTAPEGYKGRDLIPLTNANVTTLYKAHKADLELKKEGLSIYSKLKPGPSFYQAYEKIAADQAERANKKANSVPAAKSKSASELKDEETKWSSEGYRRLCMYHSGDRDQLDGLVALDKVAFYAEILSKHSPESWASLVEEAKSIIAIQAEAEA